MTVWKRYLRILRKVELKKYEEKFKGVYNLVNCVKYKTLDNTLLEYVKRAYYPSWKTSTERQRELTSII